MNEEMEKLLYRENIELAPMKKRALAFVVDDMLVGVILVISFSDAFANVKDMQEYINLINSVLLEYMFIHIAYQTFFTMQYGGSLGKLLMKIKVIEVKTLDNPNILSSLNRAIFRIVSQQALFLGFLWGMLSPSKQTWHDLTAKTLVVNA